ncbi:hypothetical protein DFH29DRAFT_880550 [Suillus ampliporus]|nr:hypothetical protein DFH29DRAFT_880550 [Suillus ampliporus]
MCAIVAQGGILWCLCKQELASGIPSGPSKDVEIFADISPSASKCYLFNTLRNREINVLCGVYHIATTLVLYLECTTVMTTITIHLISEVEGIDYGWDSRDHKLICPLYLRKCILRCLVDAMLEYAKDEAHQSAHVSIILQGWTEFNSAMTPFGCAAISQLVQVIIREFCRYLPNDLDDININNIVAFSVAILRWALGEFLTGIHITAEFKVDNERPTYTQVLNCIRDFDKMDKAFYTIMVEHILKLI